MANKRSNVVRSRQVGTASRDHRSDVASEAVSSARALPTILLTGGTGQIGSELLPLLSTMGTCVAPPRSELDLSNPEQIREFVRGLTPAIIVNAAAYTA